MKFIKKHPFSSVAFVGGAMAITGFILLFDEPAKPLILSGIFVMAMAGFVYIGEKPE